MLSKNNYLKLQLQIIIPRKTFIRAEYFNNKIDSIVSFLTQHGKELGKNIIPYLEEITANKDSSQLYRYVLMKTTDISCQRAVSLPFNNDRGEDYLPTVISKNMITTDSSHSHTTTEYLLVGIVLCLLLILIGISALYYRLKVEHSALSKDKVLTGGTSIIQMWNK